MMVSQFNNLEIKFQQRVSFQGHPFTEILCSWRDEEDMPRHALSRVWWVIQDNPMNRSHETRAFMKRRRAFEEWMKT